MIKAKIGVLVAILAVAMLVLTGCGTGIANATPVQAAQTTVKAMISGNVNVMKQIDKSNALDFPPQYMMQLATQEGFTHANFNDFTFTPVGKDSVHVTNSRINYNDTWNFVYENGGWYFTGNGE